MDASILMHPNVWKASGHVENFHDPLIDNKISKKRYRVDHLLEEQDEEIIENLSLNFPLIKYILGESFLSKIPNEKKTANRNTK